MPDRALSVQFRAPDVRPRAGCDTCSAVARFDPSRSVSTFSAGLLRSDPGRSDAASIPVPPTCAHSRSADLPGAESLRPSASGALSVLLVRFDPFQAFLLDREVAAPSRLPHKARWVICTLFSFERIGGSLRGPSTCDLNMNETS